MAIVGGIIVLIVFGLIALGVISLLFKAFINSIPQIILFGIILWVMISYTSQFFWFVGLSIVAYLVFSAWGEHIKERNIKKEFYHLFLSGNTDAIFEKFIGFGNEEKKIFLKVFSDKKNNFNNVNKNNFLDNLFVFDFSDFADKNFNKEKGYSIFEKKDCNAYMKDVWAIRIKNDFDALKSLLSDDIKIEEQKIFDQKNNPIDLIIFRKKDSVDIFSDAINLD